jgi:hypothetical protein
MTESNGPTVYGPVPSYQAARHGSPGAPKVHVGAILVLPNR